MRNTLLLPLALVASCSTEPAAAPDADASASGPVADASTPTPDAPPTSEADDATLTLEGLGSLRIGEAVPADSGWAERGAQISDACRTVSSPDYPGVYAIVESGEVHRITLGQGSSVKLAEGIGVGADEKRVRKAFAAFREAPHEYVDAPAKYLTAPNAAKGGPALRFEIGENRRVSLIHVGTMPVLGYVEGCA